MSAKRVWWISSAVVVAVAVGAAAATGVTVQRTYADLQHGTPFAAVTPEPMLAAADAADPVDVQALADALAAAANDNKALATFAGQVIDTSTGQVVWDRDGSKALTPASTTKVLTLSAALWTLGEDDVITTQIVRGVNDGEVVIKATGDVWMTAEQLDAAAEDIKKALGETAPTAVFIDTSAWVGPEQAEGWDPENVDGGYVAPMQPAMLYGGRLGATTGDVVPRSHTPALDVAQALADRLAVKTVGLSEAPANAAVVANLTSPTLGERAKETMKESDNVMAEAIAREVAAKVGAEVSFSGATEAVRQVLADHGVDLNGVTIHDGSGLSEGNRIPPAVLANLMNQAVTDETLRPLLADLPVAGGDGTLYTRYSDKSGRGWVRAKTGTLTGVSALAGTAQSNSGHLYAFGFLVNDAEDIDAARAAEDQLASILHDH